MPLTDCDGEGDCDTDAVLDAVPHCVTDAVDDSEFDTHCDVETVCVALCDSDDVSVCETLTVSDVDA